MAFVNNHLVPWFAAFAWLALSTVFGLGYAKNRGMTGIWTLVPIAVAAIVLFVGFVVLCALAVPFLDRYGRPKPDVDKDPGGPRAA